MARRIDPHALRAALAPELADLLDLVTARARRRGLTPYLVGGPVRDMLLGRPPGDLDVVVEGDAIALARDTGNATGRRVRAHGRFGTATIVLPGSTLDLVTARKERYPRPAALPVVEPSPLEDDLRRRDFTINAMAAPLGGADAGAIIDPTGGCDDLDARRIRVLHDRSFVDDPTRLWRAARYAARLEFEIESRTGHLIEEGRCGIKLLSAARLRNEIVRFFDEPAPDSALALAERLGLLEATVPGWRLSPQQLSAFSVLPQMRPADRHAAGWAIIGAGLSREEARRLAGRLDLPKTGAAALLGASSLAGQEELGEAPPSRVAKAAEAAGELSVRGAALAAADSRIRESLSRYLESYRYVHTCLAPRDLPALGVPVGPLIGEIAAKLRAARLDNLVSNYDDELALVRRALAESKGRPR